MCEGGGSGLAGGGDPPGVGLGEECGEVGPQESLRSVKE